MLFGNNVLMNKYKKRRYFHEEQVRNLNFLSFYGLGPLVSFQA
jgi:hypothetical protein